MKLRRGVLVLGMVLSLGMIPVGASASESTPVDASAVSTETPVELETVGVAVAVCGDASCMEVEGYLSGIGVASVDVATNTQVDNCQTDGDPALCHLDIPVQNEWTLTWDSGSIPAGLTYRGSLLAVQDGAFGNVGYVIGYYPESIPTATPVDPDVELVDVMAVVCSDRSCMEIERYIPDVEISSYVDGINYDACTTTGDEFSSCELLIPNFDEWSLGWDEGAIPAGLVYRGDLMAVSGGAWGEAYVLGFYPADDTTGTPTPVPVQQTPMPTKVAVASLPKTGAGQSVSHDGASLGGPAIAGLLLGGMGLVGAVAASRVRRGPGVS